MTKRPGDPLEILRTIQGAGSIKISKAGEKWVAWMEPSVHFVGTGGSPLAAMKALVERLRLMKVHRA